MKGHGSSKAQIHIAFTSHPSTGLARPNSSIRPSILRGVPVLTVIIFRQSLNCWLVISYLYKNKISKTEYVSEIASLSTFWRTVIPLLWMYGVIIHSHRNIFQAHLIVTCALLLGWEVCTALIITHYIALPARAILYKLLTKAGLYIVDMQSWDHETKE